ncbi:MAG: hypothetical protein K5668_11560 [Lachnospiraceae bacterium]|nr:hypothetical protein [Lachnospiraceae bacterium]
MLSRVNVLFTGGLDSSYTMMYFSRFPVEIQPYYLKDNRPSESYELKAINDIITDIRKNPETKANIRELITKPTYAIKPDKEIQEAYRYMFKTAGFGKQYGFIARFAKEEGLEGLFISIVVHGKVNNLVRKSGAVETVREDGMEYFRLDPGRCEKNLYRLFENVLFPPSYLHTKEEETEEMKKLGFEESIKKTWFCYWPVNGEPCGTCPPCRDLIKDGMTWRFTDAGLKRYEEDKKVPAWKHKLRDYKLTLTDKWYEFRMRHK